MDRKQIGYQVDRRVGVAPSTERFLRLEEVLKMCGKSRSSLYEAIKEGTFPPPIKLQSRSSAWVSSEIQHWIQTCIAQSRTAPPSKKRRPAP